MKLQWTETAKNDLICIQRYIAENNPKTAREWVKKLKSKAQNIVHSPFAVRKVPEFFRDDLREVIEGNYRIVYLVSSNRVSILTVFESHRLFPTENVT